MSLTWEPPVTEGSSPVKQYIIAQSTVGTEGRFEDIAAVARESRAYVVTGLAADEAYAFRVTAENEAGFSEKSAVIEKVETRTTPRKFTTSIHIYS